MTYPFLDSSVPERGGPQFEALGHAGSEHYVGLELFDNPGCFSVTYTCDEVVAMCPVTGQPDFYVMEIILRQTEKIIESKSLKLWLRQFATSGIFCEGLAVFIRDRVGEALGYLDTSDGSLYPDEIAEHIQVMLKQKSRGGISIKAVA